MDSAIFFLLTDLNKTDVPGVPAMGWFRGTCITCIKLPVLVQSSNVLRRNFL